jgi:hypothetical protein
MPKSRHERRRARDEAEKGSAFNLPQICNDKYRSYGSLFTKVLGIASSATLDSTSDLSEKAFAVISQVLLNS